VSLWLLASSVCFCPNWKLYLHDKDHLCPYNLISALCQALDRIERTSNVDFFRSIYKLPSQLVDGHMPHDEHKAYPWHKRPFHISSNNIGTDRANQQCTDSRPEIEQSNQVEKRDPFQNFSTLNRMTSRCY